jgi:hypothetical protein
MGLPSMVCRQPADFPPLMSFRMVLVICWPHAQTPNREEKRREEKRREEK